MTPRINKPVNSAVALVFLFLCYFLRGTSNATEFWGRLQPPPPTQKKKRKKGVNNFQQIGHLRLLILTTRLSMRVTPFPAVS